MQKNDTELHLCACVESSNVVFVLAKILMMEYLVGSGSRINGKAFLLKLYLKEYTP